jgi:3-deoxy-D-manno-octulosonic-acid transferase
LYEEAIYEVYRHHSVFPNDETSRTRAARSMYRILYSLTFYLIMPAVILRLFVRSFRSPAYGKRWSERFAFNSLPDGFDKTKQTIWIHAVSVGETNAAAPLIRKLKESYTGCQIYITTMTPTGSDRVSALFGEDVFHSYIPYDLPIATQRFIGKVQPSLLILMETELWPNLIHYCSSNGVKVILANGRLSEKSARSYGKFPDATKDMLDNIDFVAAQAKADMERFISAGVSSDRISVSGSLKFTIDESIEQNQLDDILGSIRDSKRIVLTAASTRDQEEEKVLHAYKNILEKFPDLLLLLIPRHPERFDRVARLCQQTGLSVIRRSEKKPIDESTQVFLGDSMGEMSAYYGLTDIAFVGGSLVDTGCQNVLEPAAMGLAVVTGPSQYNFATICSQLESVGALKTVKDENELAEFLMSVISDQSVRENMGQCGRRLVEENQQALPALIKIISSNWQ